MENEFKDGQIVLPKFKASRAFRHSSCHKPVNAAAHVLLLLVIRRLSDSFPRVF